MNKTLHKINNIFILILLLTNIFLIIFHFHIVLTTKLILIIILIIFIAYNIIELITVTKIKTFTVATKHGNVTITQKVIELLIAYLIRKYKIIKHYKCELYNKNKFFNVILYVDLILEKEDLIPDILDNLKTNIIDTLNENIGFIQLEKLNIIVNRIKRENK